MYASVYHKQNHTTLHGLLNKPTKHQGNVLNQTIFIKESNMPRVTVLQNQMISNDSLKRAEIPVTRTAHTLSLQFSFWCVLMCEKSRTPLFTHRCRSMYNLMDSKLKSETRATSCSFVKAARAKPRPLSGVTGLVGGSTPLHRML